MKKADHHLTRRVFVLGLSASILAPSVSDASGQGSSPHGVISEDRDQQKSLQKDLVAIRSLEFADEAYDDLEPLAGAIGSARLVLLGESSHGSGSDFKAKVRLIKFLCQRMDFDVIVWESGFHAMEQVNAALRSMGDPVAAAKQGIFTIWSDTREVAPLFKWVQASWLSRRPIEMAGFDTQMTAAGAEELLFEDMRQFAAASPDVELGRTIKADVERAISAYKKIGATPGSQAAVSTVGEAVGSILDLVGRHRRLFEQTNGSRKLSFIGRALENLRCLAELRYEAAQGTPGAVGVKLKDPTAFFNRRDQENARNIRWLLDVGYPGRKIIVWAHNVHICKSAFGPKFGPLTQQSRADSMVPMGQLIANRMQHDCYCIGFTSYDGSDSWVTAPKSAPIPAVPADSLEARLHAIGRPYGFINLRGRKSWPDDISKQRIFVPEPGNSSNTPDGIFALPKQISIFDGIFFIDRMTPATPVG